MKDFGLIWKYFNLLKSNNYNYFRRKSLHLWTKELIRNNQNYVSSQFDIINKKYSSSSSSITAEAIPTSTINEIPVERIRNFSIIAHVDHGKSTLADRFLEITGAITKNSGKLILDSLQVEQERGITVKAQSVTLFYKYNEKIYMLNLIDTPGHVDFSSEVSRSLSVCDGVILLVDASQGIQAQTIANYDLAKSKNLTIIPAINKIDMKNAKPDEVCADLKSFLRIDPSIIRKISAKLGTGVEQLLIDVINFIPSPNVNRNTKFRGLCFDSWYDRYRGALNLVYVNDGRIKIGDDIKSKITGKIYPIKSISILRPSEEKVEELAAGQVGLIACNMRNSKESIIGDTFHLKNDDDIQPLERFKMPQPMVYAGIYPADMSKHVALRSAIEKLCLNDSAVTVTIDSSPALGQGWRLGFLGLLHMEVFCQRLEQEYDAEPIIVAPSITYKIKLKNKKLIAQHGADTIYVSNSLLFPEPTNIDEYFEPYVKGTIITPTEYLGSIMGLCIERRGILEKSVNIDDNRILMAYKLPLSEIIHDFNDKLKTISSGYASFNYENCGYYPTTIVKLEIRLNGKIIDEFSRMAHTSKVTQIARDMVLRLKDLIPRQMVQIAIQACIGNKVIARETIKAYRKDVTAKLYGGDVTRRMKLLKQQAEGKKKMRSIANIQVPQDTYINLLKK